MIIAKFFSFFLLTLIFDPQIYLKYIFESNFHFFVPLGNLINRQFCFEIFSYESFLYPREIGLHQKSFYYTFSVNFFFLNGLPLNLLIYILFIIIFLK